MESENIDALIARQQNKGSGSRAIFRTRVFRVSELIDIFRAKKLRFIGEEPFIKWELSQKAPVIESILWGLPVRSIMIDGSDSLWYVVEGAEVLSAIFEYVSDGFSLDYVSFPVGKYSGVKFSELPLRYRSLLYNLEVTATMINPGTPNLQRLSLYNTSLLKIGKNEHLWNCAKIVYPVAFEALSEKAIEFGIADPQIFLRLLIARIFAERLKSGFSTKDQALAEMRFDLFECMLLDYFDMIDIFIKIIPAEQRAVMGQLAAYIKRNSNNTKIWDEKKRTIFTLVLGLLTDSPRIYDLLEFGNLFYEFRKAWTDSGRRGVRIGPLYADYAKKTSVIYKRIIDDTQYRADKL